MRYVVGVDIGGSHVTCCLVDLLNEKLIDSSLIRLNCNSNESSFIILETWKNCINKCLSTININKIDGIGFAMPGPFIYEKGISQMYGLGKFDSLYGVNIPQYFSTAFYIPIDNIKFLNDAACFALGEYYFGAARGYTKGIFLTIGTGFGSTFLENGNVLNDDDNDDRIPKNGWLYNVTFQDGIAEDYFSNKWIVKRYKELIGEEYSEVKEIPENEILKTVFHEFSTNLAKFLESWILKFKPECLVIGGSILQFKNNLILPVLKKCLDLIGINIDVKKAELYENAAVIGASKIFKKESLFKTEYRKTNQKLLPIYNDEINENEKYNIYPTFDCGNGKISIGYESLINEFINEKCLIIDGCSGVNFDIIRIEINRFLIERNKSVLWYESLAARKSKNEIDLMLESFLGGDDPLFGKRCQLNLIEFFNKNNFSYLKRDLKFDINILIGIGSSLYNWDGPIIYFDIVKNEIQYRSRAKFIFNFGLDKPLNNKEAYKRFYFVDWPVLNSYKNEIKNKINILVDDQRIGIPIWIKNSELIKVFLELSKSVVRVRPWFETGVWGGNWMMKNIPKLEQNTINYAWSFELIVPENGIILMSDKIMLEIPFEWFMFYCQKQILGEKESKIFGYEFPIRFDFLDTFDGDNLSIQCHAGSEYMKNNFGETLPQDETYYILDSKDNAKVYLGFQDGVNKIEFRNEVENSFKTSTDFDINKYVQAHASQKHDYFLIPHGTIHGSGKNNLVLEISSTPYIFTFKIYDWLRADLDGKPRTLNIKRAFDNLNFNMQGKKVQNELICNPILIDSGPDWKIFHLKTHEIHFYDVNRIEFLTKILISTNNQFHVLMLVDGDQIEVKTENKYIQILSYAETFIIPASAKCYEIRNKSNKICKVVKAFIKKSFLENFDIQ